MAEEPPFTAGEAARLAALLAKGAYLVHRGKPVAKVEKQIDDLKTEAWKRVAAERQARERLEDQKRQERAEKRVARRWF